jgi:hypothetical protein
MLLLLPLLLLIVTVPAQFCLQCSLSADAW